MAPEAIDGALRVAHDAGIRLVDTAAASHNEHIIAATLKELSPPMAVETKVTNSSQIRKLFFLDKHIRVHV